MVLGIRLMAVFGLFAGTGLAGAAPIYLKPGQCIQIGSQEVCAMQSDKPTTTPDHADRLHVCRYDFHQGSETPQLKNYALIRVLTTENGNKSETVLKQFGINDTDKATCEKEADRLNAPKP